MCVTICGRFCPDEGAVAGYGNRIRAKYTAKWGVQIAGMIFQTSSRMKINGFLMHLVQYIDSLCQPRLLQTGLCYIYGNIEGSNHKHEISEYHR